MRLVQSFNLPVSLCLVGLLPLTAASKVLLHLGALEYDSNLEIDEDVYKTACVEGPPEDMNPMAPDAQTTETDEECRALGSCHISVTLPGESVSYLFFPDELELNEYYLHSATEEGTIAVDITVRVAGGENSTRAIDLQIVDSEGVDVSGQQFIVNGRGYQQFYDITWHNVQLDVSKYYEIFVIFTDGRVNMCSVKVSLPEGELGAVSIPIRIDSYNDTTAATRIAPIVWSALEYTLHDGIDVDIPPEKIDGGEQVCKLRDDGVHAQRTTDTVCLERDNSPCTVAFTEALEFLTYRFGVPQGSDGIFEIMVRAATAQGGKMISLELRNVTAETNESFLGKRFEVPHGDGSWELYHDIRWLPPHLISGEYFLDVRFLTGHVNVCSVSVIDINPSAAIGTQMQAPGLFNALNFIESNDTTPEFNQGNCTTTPRGGVDAQETVDPVCVDAMTFAENSNMACTIAFTEAGESMTYQFQTNATYDMLDFSFRVASYDSHRRFLVEVDPSMGGISKVFLAPGKGFHKYESITWEEVEVEPLDMHEVRVTFLDGKINLCAIELRYTIEI